VIDHLLADAIPASDKNPAEPPLHFTGRSRAARTSAESEPPSFGVEGIKQFDGLNKPFSITLINRMWKVARRLADELFACKIAC
jgi:hypothetical protein